MLVSKIQPISFPISTNKIESSNKKNVSSIQQEDTFEKEQQEHPDVIRMKKEQQENRKKFEILINSLGKFTIQK